MAKCEVCGKSMQTGHKISITRSQVSRRANKMWKANIKKIKINDNGEIRPAHVCTKCMRAGKVIRVIGSSNKKPMPEAEILSAIDVNVIPAIELEV